MTKSWLGFSFPSSKKTIEKNAPENVSLEPISSLANIFRASPINHSDQETIQEILEQYKLTDTESKNDLKELLNITAEIRTITNQAAILHGQRIKKAQEILKNYRNGAFSAWLVAAYGNRQTPYNFLQYYEFYTSLPQPLRTKLDEMPKQVIYTLASRSGPLQEKEGIIRNYTGQPKQEILALIRQTFPLQESDGRTENCTQQAINTLKRLKSLLSKSTFSPTEEQTAEIESLLDFLRSLIKV